MMAQFTELLGLPDVRVKNKKGGLKPG